MPKELQLSSPVGGALTATLQPERRLALLSFTPPYQSDLLLKLEQMVQKEGIQFLKCRYLENPPLQQFLKECGFQDPELHKTGYWLTNDYNAAWLKRTPSLPTTPWIALTDEQLSSVKQLITHGRVPERLSPFTSSFPLEPLNSLALIKNDQVVGWMVTHRLSEDLIRYSSLYVLPEERAKGAALALLAQSILLQTDSPIKQALFEIYGHPSFRTWGRFIERQLAPYCYKIERKFVSFKEIDSIFD